MGRRVTGSSWGGRAGPTCELAIELIVFGEAAGKVVAGPNRWLGCCKPVGVAVDRQNHDHPLRVSLRQPVARPLAILLEFSFHFFLISNARVTHFLHKRYVTFLQPSNIIEKWENDKPMGFYLSMQTFFVWKTCNFSIFLLFYVLKWLWRNFNSIGAFFSPFLSP